MVGEPGFGRQFREVWRRRATYTSRLGHRLTFKMLEAVVVSKTVQGTRVWGEGRPSNRLEPGTAKIQENQEETG